MLRNYRLERLRSREEELERAHKTIEELQSSCRSLSEDLKAAQSNAADSSSVENLKVQLAEEKRRLELAEGHCSRAEEDLRLCQAHILQERQDRED